MNTKIFFGILVLISGMITGWFMMGNSNQIVPYQIAVTEQAEIEPSVASADASLAKGDMKTDLTVIYRDDGFSPKTLTVRRGNVVTFVNMSSRGMWVASGMHPTHQLLPGFDQLSAAAKNGTYTYTFDKVGTWQYHNHVRPTDDALIVVTEQ